MLNIGGATRIYLAAGGTDLRKSFEGLSGLVREKLRGDPLSGHVFLFCNPNRALHLAGARGRN
jgi:transposase